MGPRPPSGPPQSSLCAPCTPEEDQGDNGWIKPDKEKFLPPDHRKEEIPPSALKAKRPKMEQRQITYVDGLTSVDIKGNGLETVESLTSFRQEPLWFSQPGAMVACDTCGRSWPQNYGYLTGSP